jgi:hypothetical protein
LPSTSIGSCSSSLLSTNPKHWRKHNHTSWGCNMSFGAHKHPKSSYQLWSLSLSCWCQMWNWCNNKKIHFSRNCYSHITYYILHYILTVERT